jgi:hypothetical protein
VRGEYVAMLSIVGSAGCVAGVWLMRRVKNNSESHAKPFQSPALVDQKRES